MAGDESKGATAAVVAGLVFLVALVVPLFFLFRMASAPPADPAALKNVPKVRKDKVDKDGGKRKGRKGAIDRMRDAARDDDDGAGLAAGLREDADEAEDDADDAKAAAKRAERQAAAREREEAREAMRERDEQKNATRRQKDEAREEKQRAKEEAERLKREADAKKQQEEFDKWKDLITVDDEGTDEAEAGADSEGLLANFVSYIKEHKVVVLEDLAAAFELRVQDVISRVQGLEAMGYITGVIDDRGKFIYISVAEMDAVADFINKRGRISISALAAESNKLIDLNSKVIAADAALAEEDADAILETATERAASANPSHTSECQ
ncbi:hypothetical protein KFE25_010287 [Diacronema lutheri]|uniref:DDRGK domain-containing protein 1 n=1 Tax=Diacronema lutheri TaxID=2081491 RepID=A0A8J5XER9_DIALT|nr:hypothetical protein KFE25_010287 [Diacronema lutheri]